MLPEVQFLVRAVEEQLVEAILSQVRDEAQEAGRALAAEQVEELVAEARVLVPVQELEQVQVLELVEEAVAGDRARELVAELVLGWVEAEEPEVVGRYCPE